MDHEGIEEALEPGDQGARDVIEPSEEEDVEIIT